MKVWGDNMKKIYARKLNIIDKIILGLMMPNLKKIKKKGDFENGNAK